MRWTKRIALIMVTLLFAEVMNQYGARFYHYFFVGLTIGIVGTAIGLWAEQS